MTNPVTMPIVGLLLDITPNYCCLMGKKNKKDARESRSVWCSQKSRSCMISLPAKIFFYNVLTKVLCNEIIWSQKFFSCLFLRFLQHCLCHSLVALLCSVKAYKLCDFRRFPLRRCRVTGNHVRVSHSSSTFSFQNLHLINVARQSCASVVKTRSLEVVGIQRRSGDPPSFLWGALSNSDRRQRNG